jgi:hypothetical protein
MARKKTTGLIQSFNMADPEERAAMFKAKSPERMTMMVYVLVHYQDCAAFGGIPKGRFDWEWDGDDIKPVLEEVAHACIAKSPFPHLDCQVIVKEEDDEGFSELDWVPTEQIHEDWAVAGTMPIQVGFFDCIHQAPVQLPIEAVYAAMTMYDTMYAATGAVNPKDHVAIEATARDDMAFRIVVNDIYRERLGIWCSDLMTLRNEVMIRVRARLYGDDPETEWKRFCDAGFVHPFDYLRIWTSPADRD